MFKKFTSLVFVAALSIFAISPASAVDKVKYKNCTKLSKVYPGGVAKTGGSNMTKSKGKLVPAKSKKIAVVDDVLYNLNIKLDADKDGVACEK